jgi:hypothetical protein
MILSKRLKQLLEKILMIQCNNLLSLFFHSLIFLFLKLGGQSKDWLFFMYICLTNVLCIRTGCFRIERSILKPPLTWWFFLKL